MTVEVLSALSPPFHPNGSTASFDFSFKIGSVAEVEVLRLTAAGATTTESPSLYSVSLASDGEGGTITYHSPPASSTDVLYAHSNPSFAQVSTFTNGGFLPSTINPGLDRAAIRDLWLRGELARALRTPFGEGEMILPPALARAGLILGFDGAGGAVAVPLLAGPRGNPGGNVMSIGSRDEAFGVTVNAGANRLATDGAVVVSDGGAADYIRDSEQPSPTADASHQLTSLGKALAATAAVRGVTSSVAIASARAMENRFRIVDVGLTRFRLHGKPDHRVFKASGDTTLATIQAMLDAYNYWGQELGKIAPGSHTLGGSLYVSRGEAPGYYYQVQLKGAGKKFYNGVGFGTALVFTDKTRPGLILQAYRHSSVHDMTLIGAVYGALSAVYLGGIAPVDGLGDLIDDTDVATWYTYAGLSARRYAPHAAIALDPRGGTAPGGGAGTLTAPLPTDLNPDWLGPTAQYDKSVGSTFETNCEMLGWEVGLCDPAPTNSQGDYTTGQKISVALSIYGVGPSRTQGRNFTLYEANIALVHTGITNRVFGMQQGKLGGTVTMSGGASIQMFDLDGSIMGGLTAQDCYAEAQHKIADVVAGTYSNGAFKIVGGSFELTGGNVRRGMAPYHIGDPSAPANGIPATVPVKVEGAFFGVPDVLVVLANDLTFDGQILSRTMLSNMIDPASSEIDGSGFDKKIASASERRARRMAHNGTLGLITPMMKVSGEHRISGALFEIDSNGVAVQATTGRLPYTLTGRKYGIPHWQRTVYYPDGGEDINTAYAVEMPQSRFTIPKSTIVGLTRTGTRWAGTLPAGYRGANAYVAALRNIGPGRVAYDDEKGTAYWVCSYDFTTGAIVIEQFYNYYIAAGQTVPQPRLALTGSGGNLTFVETAFFTPSSPLIGDVSTGSAVITNLRRSSDGDDTWVAGANASMPVADDWLYYNPALPPATQPFTGAASRVVSIDTGAKTLTMSGNANLNATGVALPLWRRGS